MAIVCKSANEIEKMRRSGHIVRQVLDHVRALVGPGVTTMDLERAAEKKIIDLGAKPAFKGYFDYHRTGWRRPEAGDSEIARSHRGFPVSGYRAGADREFDRGRGCGRAGAC